MAKQPERDPTPAPRADAAPDPAGPLGQMEAGVRWAHRALQRAYRVGGNEPGGTEDEFEKEG